MDRTVNTGAPPVDPHLRRWMMFVDGENLTMRAQQLARRAHVQLIEGPRYSPDTFVWLPRRDAQQYPDTMVVRNRELPLQNLAVRSHYYTSVVGDEPRLQSVKEALWDIGFEPKVFKKTRQQDKAKGVDVALTTDLLSNAFHNNYDVAVLCAGDGDYVPLVQEVKRLGKVVNVLFFSNAGMSDDLQLAADWFVPFERDFLDWWRVESRFSSGGETTEP